MPGAETTERRPTGAIRADFTIDQNWDAYTEDEHARWDRLFARMAEIVPGRATPDFTRAIQQVKLSERGVPNLAELSDRLEPMTGWRVVPVAGLVPDDVFFDHLANRRFPAGAFLRSEAEFDYIEEPDIFHDVFGHVPLLADPTYAAFMEAYGKAGPKAIAAGALPMLARLYWYTIEFGLIETGEGLRIFGAGILSSPNETRFAVEDPSPNRIGFDLERVMTTDYRIDDFQQTYFVIESFAEMLDACHRDFAPIYGQMGAAKVAVPPAVLPGDRVLHRGSQAYFKAKEVA